MTIALFYRNPHSYEERREAFLAEGVSNFFDTQEQTAEVSRDLGFPVAYGMTRTDGDALGSWWEERRDHIQPSECN